MTKNRLPSGAYINHCICLAIQPLGNCIDLLVLFFMINVLVVLVSVGISLVM